MKSIDVLRRLGGGNSGGSGGGGGTSTGRIVLLDDFVTGIKRAEWIIAADGFTYQKKTDLSTQAAAWISPRTGMSSYDVKAHVTDGDVPAVGTVDAWLNMSADYTWGWDLTSSHKSCHLEISIRDSTSLAVQKTVTITITASGVA
jgi:hypothetical protein